VAYFCAIKRFPNRSYHK